VARTPRKQVGWDGLRPFGCQKSFEFDQLFRRLDDDGIKSAERKRLAGIVAGMSINTTTGAVGNGKV
jgi:hypothetical protein